jgi:hypothetical protein
MIVDLSFYLLFSEYPTVHQANLKIHPFLTQSVAKLIHKSKRFEFYNLWIIPDGLTLGLIIKPW